MSNSSSPPEGTPLEVVFLPWADIAQDRSVGPFTIWPWEPGGVVDPQVSMHLETYFRRHVDAGGQPVPSISIVTERERCNTPDQFAPMSPERMLQARQAADILLFASVYPAVRHALRGQQRPQCSPPTAEAFQVAHQRFRPGDESVAVSTGRTVSVNQITNVLLQRPGDVGGPAFLNEDILDALGSLISCPTHEELSRRILRSLEWFRMAHASDHTTSPLTKVVMMATAFEILLQIPDTRRTQEFIQRVEERVCTPETRRETREVTVSKGKKKGQPRTVDHTLPGWWTNNFYDLRSRVVHGDEVPSERLVYRDWVTQLIVADYVFGRCLEFELQSARVLHDSCREIAETIPGMKAQEDINAAEKSIRRLLCPYRAADRQLGWLPD